MCSIILRIEETGIFIAANRDEMLARPWLAPAAHWRHLPGLSGRLVGGLDETAGGTWMALNAHGVMAAVLNRHGTLGPAPNKRSRGELPLLALRHANAEAAAAAAFRLDAAAYRSFNLVIADAHQAFCISAKEDEGLVSAELGYGTWMITSGEPNEMAMPRIARHLPKFEAAPWPQWRQLLADREGPFESALNITPRNGFGTVCASLLALPRGDDPDWQFAAGPPHEADFVNIPLPG